MRNNSADKVKQIINEEFDSRMSGAVVNYIISAGWEHLKDMTEEDIKQIKSETNIMTDEFVQCMVRTAAKICKECNLFDDFIPYIIMENFNCHVPVREIVFDTYDFDTKEDWMDFLEQFNIYDEKTSFVRLGAFVKGTDAEEE